MNRFELEESIMSCWSTKEDIMLVSERVMEETLSEDQLANVLTGIAELHELKCRKLFEIFEGMLSSGRIINEELEIPEI
jgi:hypothetical protein